MSKHEYLQDFQRKIYKIMQAMFGPETMKSIKKAYNVRYAHVIAKIMIYERQETSKYIVLEAIIYSYNSTYVCLDYRC